MKKLYVLLLVGSGLLVLAYFLVRFYLQSDIRRSREEDGQSYSSSKRPDSTIDLRPLFIAKLQELIKEGSKGLYNISMDSLDVDLLQSEVVLMNVRLLHNKEVLLELDRSKQAPDDVFTASFDTLKLSGINLDEILTQRTIDLKEILISGPTIEVYHTKRSYNSGKPKDSLSLYDRIMKNMDRIAIESVVIQKGKLTSHNIAKKNKQTTFNDVELRFKEILVDSSTRYAKDRFLFAKQATLSMENYALKSKDNLYMFKLGKLLIQAPQQTIIIDNLSMAPRFNKQQFQKQLVLQKEQYDLKAPKIIIRNIDWWGLINEERFIADKLEMPNAVLKIFLDRSLPRPKSKMGNFPHQLIMKIPIQIYIAGMYIRNFNLTYEEYNPISTQSGSLRFDNINLNVSDITNIPQQIKVRKQTIVTGTARFKEVPVKAKFMFDLMNYKSGRFTSSFSTGGFEGSIMNDISIPLGLLKIEKSNVKDFAVTLQGDERKASGKVLMLYNGFKISLYEKEKDEKSLDKKGVIGFIANTFIIKDNNPEKNRPARNPQVEFNRDPQAGFFNLVWKTALSGILETIGVDPKRAARK